MSGSACHALATAFAIAFLSMGTAGAQEAKDTSGTNPAVLTRTLAVSNEYRFLPNDEYYDITNLRYTEPFFDGKASVRLTMPLDGTNLTGDEEFGIGDIAAKASWIPYLSRRQAFILSTEIYAPTASEDVLGTGKWVAAPGLTWAYFASPEIIIAPAYIHSFSFAGDSDREDVNRGDFDFYVVYKPHAKRWWLTSDVTASYDFEAKTAPMSWEVALGFNLGKLPSGGAINGYIRPGVGIGNDRPYNFNIEVGVSLVSF
ncbi:MAG: hypothetical protein EOR12_06220 [Mesorhizobium sp.]|uniref:hypothetical protein n=1 Tax=Mesorhizobium sp. TaxID=1871066 RepID=UPI000FE82A5C|nr:hypothetical protein [Mesorhizobium sp.]RWP92247.1 MAG: hypothetical protein EOR12_06220 [Mesorhizobium sp.]